MILFNFLFSPTNMIGLSYFLSCIVGMAMTLLSLIIYTPLIIFFMVYSVIFQDKTRCLIYTFCCLFSSLTVPFATFNLIYKVIFESKCMWVSIGLSIFTFPFALLANLLTLLLILNIVESLYRNFPIFIYKNKLNIQIVLTALAFFADHLEFGNYHLSFLYFIIVFYFELPKINSLEPPFLLKKYFYFCFNFLPNETKSYLENNIMVNSTLFSCDKYHLRRGPTNLNVILSLDTDSKIFGPSNNLPLKHEFNFITGKLETEFKDGCVSVIWLGNQTFYNSVTRERYNHLNEVINFLTKENVAVVERYDHGHQKVLHILSMNKICDFILGYNYCFKYLEVHDKYEIYGEDFNFRNLIKMKYGFSDEVMDVLSKFTFNFFGYERLDCLYKIWGNRYNNRYRFNKMGNSQQKKLFSDLKIMGDRYFPGLQLKGVCLSSPSEALKSALSGLNEISKSGKDFFHNDLINNLMQGDEEFEMKGKDEIKEDFNKIIKCDILSLDKKDKKDRDNEFNDEEVEVIKELRAKFDVKIEQVELNIKKYVDLIQDRSNVESGMRMSNEKWKKALSYSKLIGIESGQVAKFKAEMKNEGEAIKNKIERIRAEIEVKDKRKEELENQSKLMGKSMYRKWLKKLSEEDNEILSGSKKLENQLELEDRRLKLFLEKERKGVPESLMNSETQDERISEEWAKLVESKAKEETIEIKNVINEVKEIGWEIVHYKSKRRDKDNNSGKKMFNQNYEINLFNFFTVLTDLKSVSKTLSSKEIPKEQKKSVLQSLRGDKSSKSKSRNKGKNSRNSKSKKEDFDLVFKEESNEVKLFCVPVNKNEVKFQKKKKSNIKEKVYTDDKGHIKKKEKCNSDDRKLFFKKWCKEIDKMILNSDIKRPNSQNKIKGNPTSFYSKMCNDYSNIVFTKDGPSDIEKFKEVKIMKSEADLSYNHLKSSKIIIRRANKILSDCKTNLELDKMDPRIKEVLKDIYGRKLAFYIADKIGEAFELAKEGLVNDLNIRSNIEIDDFKMHLLGEIEIDKKL